MTTYNDSTYNDFIYNDFTYNDLTLLPHSYSTCKFSIYC
jgi:hypothetical protein